MKVKYTCKKYKKYFLQGKMKTTNFCGLIITCAHIALVRALLRSHSLRSEQLTDESTAASQHRRPTTTSMINDKIDDNSGKALYVNHPYKNFLTQFLHLKIS